MEKREESEKTVRESWKEMERACMNETNIEIE